MIDKSRPEAAPALPRFTPVPRATQRHDGWTAERQERFIEALATTGSVKSAALAVNMAAEGAYALRRHKDGKSFARAWEKALAGGVQGIEDAAMERALNGVEVPVYHCGEIIGTRIAYNDALVMFMLRNRAARRFKADARHRPDAVDKAALAKLKKQWRGEWEKEWREAEAAEDANGRDFDIRAEMTQMHRRWYAALSPRARAAYRRFRRIERADAAAGWEPGMDDADAPAIEAEYDEVFANDRRAPIAKWAEVDGHGVEEILEEAGEEDDCADGETLEGDPLILSLSEDPGPSQDPPVLGAPEDKRPDPGPSDDPLILSLSTDEPEPQPEPEPVRAGWQPAPIPHCDPELRRRNW